LDRKNKKHYKDLWLSSKIYQNKITKIFIEKLIKKENCTLKLTYSNNNKIRILCETKIKINTKFRYLMFIEFKNYKNLLTFLLLILNYRFYSEIFAFFLTII